MEDPRAQAGATIGMDWGRRGAEAICRAGGVAVVVDVLSFTTTLTVAVDAGAEVYPFPFNDASASEFARLHRATLAVGRFEARGSHPGEVSLSPASVRAAAGLARIVLPSPNGSALARVLADRGVTVVGAALRNRKAVARWLAGRLAAATRTLDTVAGQPGAGSTGAGSMTAVSAVAVIAAGERWADESLRPAVEDLWGAGAVIAAVRELTGAGLSQEARAAAAAFADVAAELPACLADCASGRELVAKGLAEDVAIAAELDASHCVPVLSGQRFVNAG